MTTKEKLTKCRLTGNVFGLGGKKTKVHILMLAYANFIDQNMTTYSVPINFFFFPKQFGAPDIGHLKIKSVVQSRFNNAT